MSTSARSTPGRQRGGRRAAGVLFAAALGMGGLAACSDPVEPEAGAVTAEDLQSVEDDLAALEERIGVLEEGAGEDEEPEPATEEESGVPEDESEVPEEESGVLEDESGVFGDADELIGQDVTVTAVVSEVMTSSGVGAAFRIGSDSGEAVAVLSATAPEQRLEIDDVVRVSGTVVEVRRDTFEQDVGIAADALLGDADAFFAEFDGAAALSAARVEMLPEQAGD